MGASPSLIVKRSVSDGATFGSAITAQLGISQSDSSRITQVLVSYVVVSNLDGTVVNEYVAVSLGLRDRDFSVALRLEPSGTERFVKEEPLNIPASR